MEDKSADNTAFEDEQPDVRTDSIQTNGKASPTSPTDNDAVEPEKGDDRKVSIQATEKVVTLSEDKKPRESVCEERDGWGNKIEFVLAIVGYAVGLGNVWRFPYLAQKNGGGAFLIPYVISLLLMGIPLFFLELAVGQRKRKGPLHVWDKMYKPLSGMGLAAVVASFMVGVYYNMIVAWCFYYFFISFQKNVPYASCPIIGYSANGTTPIFLPECLRATKTTYYYYRVALDATTSLDESGGLNWKLTLCLLLSWIVIFAITCKGVESMGKAVYFTAIFPYVVLIIFFIRTMMLEGAGEGIKHMFSPDFAKLQRAETWLEASTQIFYSLGLSFGGLISMSSYNDINNDVIRDALLVSTVNCGTSVFAGIVIFGILGYKATTNYKNCLADQEFIKNHSTLINVTAFSSSMTSSSSAIQASYTTLNSINHTIINTTKTCDLQSELNNVASGPGLTFIAFTEAMSTMDVTQLWSVLFFMMLLTLGIGSMLGTFEAVRTTVVDLQLLPMRMEFVSLILCGISFLFGLLFCQRSGEYWLQMFDTYSANMALLTLGLLEIIVVIYMYGYQKFEQDVEFMLNKKLNLYWKINLKYTAPILILVIIFATIYGLITDGMTYQAYNPKLGRAAPLKYPGWAVAVSIILMLTSLICVPIVAILVKYDKFKLPGFKEELKIDIRRRSSVIPMHPDQHRRESVLLQRRISRMDLDVIKETEIAEEDDGVTDLQV